MTDDAAPPTSSRRILKATAVAFGVALVLLVAVVLPAEYGIDPLGTGRAMGLTALSGAMDAELERLPDVAQDETASGVRQPGGPYHEDVYEVELRPFEGVEYKYRIEQGGTLVYSWTATSEVGYEFHGEPDGAPVEYFDSYAKGAATEAHGDFTAEKPGIHGWFWENPGVNRVTVRLQTAGFYSGSTEYRDGERIHRQFPD